MGWVSGFTYRKAITISHTNIDADLTDFPITLVLTSSNHAFSSCRSDGYDVIFTSSDETTQIYFEREYYDSTNSKARFHIKIPSVTASSDTTFYMYYGDSDASDSAYHSKTSVWDSNYKLVLHIGASLNDSTSNGNNCSVNGTSVVDTDYGKARSFGGGTSDYVTPPTAITQNLGSNFTILMMSKLAAYGDTSYKYFLDLGYGYIHYMIQRSNAWGIGFYGGSAWNESTMTSGFDLNPHVLTGKYNKTSLDFFCDQTKYSVAKTSDCAAYNVRTGYIGMAEVLTQSYYGNIYEARYSNTARSDAWVKAESHALKISLTTIGTEETSGGGTTKKRRFAQII